MIGLRVSLPNHEYAVQQIRAEGLSAGQLESYTTEVAREAMELLLTYLGRHVRTGQTIGSIHMRLLESSADSVTVAMGTQSRGNQLRWLDKGRKAVYPIRRRFLRFVTFPDGALVYTKMCRATVGSDIMRSSAEAAMLKSSAIGAKMKNQSYVR